MIDTGKHRQRIQKKLLSLPLWQRRLLVFGTGLLLLVLFISVCVALSGSLGTSKKLVLESSAFKAGESLPNTYTCNADNINPPLTFSNIPEKTKSLALLIEDAKEGSEQVSWMVFNIPVDNATIMEGIRPAGTVARNHKGNFGYSGPCPDKSGTYVFRAYALKSELADVNSGVSRDDFLKAVKANLVAKTELEVSVERKK